MHAGPECPDSRVESDDGRRVTGVVKTEVGERVQCAHSTFIHSCTAHLLFSENEMQVTMHGTSLAELDLLLAAHGSLISRRHVHALRQKKGGETTGCGVGVWVRQQRGRQRGRHTERGGADGVRGPAGCAFGAAGLQDPC